MSVAHLTAREFGIFAGICVKLEAGTLAEACQLCEIAAAGNRKAFEHQYGEFVSGVSASDVEREALDALVNPTRLVDESFGPIAYNMVANDGTTYSASGQINQEDEIIERLSKLEDAARKWQEAKQREKTRAAENDAAYAEVGPLEILTAGEITTRCEAAGCQRVIVASFGVDETETMTDYFGGRTARTVVIGFGKGKRENFKQLRKAAAAFPPTAHLGPGLDTWHIWYYHEDPKAGQYTPASKADKCFTTEADAEAWIQGEIRQVDEGGNDYSQTGICAKWHGYKLSCDSVENRENWSMGGGNYLGQSRYGGWQVGSQELRYFSSDMEFYEPPHKQNGEAKRAKRKTVRVAAVVAPDFTDWL